MHGDTTCKAYLYIHVLVTDENFSRAFKFYPFLYIAASHCSIPYVFFIEVLPLCIIQVFLSRSLLVNGLVMTTLGLLFVAVSAQSTQTLEL